MTPARSVAPEDQLVNWLRKRTAVSGRTLIGDDAALLPAGGPWAVTTDQQIEGVHVATGFAPAAWARRLLQVNLSDLAAVGARPRFAFAALAAPGAFDHRSFLGALAAAGRRCGLQLAGGDLATAGRVHATLTLVGDRPRRGRWLERGAARPGDRLWLGGVVGQSALGRFLLAAGARVEGRRIVLPPKVRQPRELAAAARGAVRRHLAPRAQLELGLSLGRRQRCAAIDVSDGLALDLHRLCRASAVGARIHADRLPLSRHARDLAQRLEADALEAALGGGEDYVLLFALPRTSRAPAGCKRVGEIVAGSGVQLVTEDGETPLRPLGWDHLAGGSGNLSPTERSRGPADREPSG
ncbi:MAG: thiamine-phosphate kinase [Thermoanaerobaculia bacterium]|nr:thiamine-phosphate kinase [Thermoanaerobaculia bacterium]